MQCGGPPQRQRSAIPGSILILTSLMILRRGVVVKKELINLGGVNEYQ